jgi:hypothetical protein
MWEQNIFSTIFDFKTAVKHQTIFLKCYAHHIAAKLIFFKLPNRLH